MIWVLYGTTTTDVKKSILFLDRSTFQWEKEIDANGKGSFKTSHFTRGAVSIRFHSTTTRKGSRIESNNSFDLVRLAIKWRHRTDIPCGIYGNMSNPAVVYFGSVRPCSCLADINSVFVLIFIASTKGLTTRCNIEHENMSTPTWVMGSLK